MQVGRDCDGMEEVRGSNPLSSTDVRPSQRLESLLERAAHESRRCDLGSQARRCSSDACLSDGRRGLLRCRSQILVPEHLGATVR